MDLLCPVSTKEINEKAARIGAGLVLACALAGLMGRCPWVFLYLAVDFFVRGLLSVSGSPISVVSRTAARRFGLTPRLANAGPKIFAARLGLLCSTAATVLYLLEMSTAGDVVAGMLCVCAALEAFFGLCLGWGVIHDPVLAS